MRKLLNMGTRIYNSQDDGLIDYRLIRPVLYMILLLGHSVNMSMGQSSAGECPSYLSVSAGSSKMINCVEQTNIPYRYQWRSPDPSWLEYLSDVTLASPILNAPDDVQEPLELTYWRLSFDYQEHVSSESSVSITVYPAERLQRDRRILRSQHIENVVLLEDKVRRMQVQVPYLRCASQVTAESGGMAEISCTAPSDELLTYRIEYDWPPYGETKIHEGGSFDYLIQVPLITASASVRNLEISAYMHEKKIGPSQNVEIHVVNNSPDLSCEDIIVDEATQVDSPCSVNWKGDVRYQFISQPLLVQRGIYDHWPVFAAPEVRRDTSFSVTVRAFGVDASQVVEDEFMVMVRDTATPFDLNLECIPSNDEVYEGEVDSIEIICSHDLPQTGEIAFTFGWSPPDAPGLEILERMEKKIRFEFSVPIEVDNDSRYRYTVTVTLNIGEDPENDIVDSATFTITVLSKPDLFVNCGDKIVRTGDPPIPVCNVTNTKELELIYDWSWMPVDGLLIPERDGTLLFKVPETQEALVEEYIYNNITVSAKNAELPETKEKVTITVNKDLGRLRLSCVSPIEVYEGSGDYPLGCSITDRQTDDDVIWFWQPQGNTEDLLRPGSDGAPVFQTPASVTENKTYIYQIQADSPPHYSISESEIVEVKVLKRPVISLDCPQEIVFAVGIEPQPIECTATNDLDLDLEYVWLWEPPTLLSESTISNPLFSVPSQQRPYSYTYSYTVTVSADHADPAEAEVTVIVINPAVELSESVAISISELDIGVVGPKGFVLLDPATEQVSGLLYEGGETHSGRMTIRAQDSITVSIELFQITTLRRTGTSFKSVGESPRSSFESSLRGDQSSSQSAGELTLIPRWAHSESCTRFLANTQTSQAAQIRMNPGDCQMIRLGGKVDLQEAEPGKYTGDIGVVMTINNVDELFTVPVSLIVEAEQQVVVLGPKNVDIQPVPPNDSALNWEQSITIYPQVAVLGPNAANGIFQIGNPSIHPMEVAVSTSFGYREAHIDSPLSVSVTGDLANLAEVISIRPSVILLLPGETKQVHYAIPEQELEKMENRGYAGMFNFTATSRTYIEQRRPIAEQQARIMFQSPAVYIPERGPQHLGVTVESRTDQAVQLLIKTDMYPFYGYAVIEEASGRELGRSEILVYTQSRVRIVLDEMSDQELTLRFIPHDLNQNTPLDVYIPADS